MKFEEALNIAEGNLITEENKNEEVLLEIMPLNYYNKIMADPNISSIKKYNARVISAESKAYKGRAIKNGIDKVITIPSANGFELFQSRVFEVVQEKTKNDAKKGKEETEIFNKALANLKDQIKKYTNFSN